MWIGHSLHIVIFKIIFLLIVGQQAVDLRAQQPSERDYRPLPEPVRMIDLDELNMYRPASLTMNSEGNVALYDYGVHQLFLIPFSNDDIRTIGDGKGSGPREFQNPIGLDFDMEGYLWVVDANQARLTVWNQNDELLKNEILDQFIPYRIAVGDRRAVVISHNLQPEGLFHLYEKEPFTKIKIFEPFDSEGYTHFEEADGEIISISSGLFFTHRYNSYFKKYNWSGDLIYKRNTIEEVIFPGLERLDGGGIRMPMDASIATVRAASDGKSLFLLYGGQDQRIGRVIDVYEVETGRYLHSYDVEKRAVGLATSGRLLALMQHEEGSFEILIYDTDDF